MKHPAPDAAPSPVTTGERHIASISAADRFTRPTADLGGLVRPIIGIENRTAQEVFDIMADRISAVLSRSGL